MRSVSGVGDFVMQVVGWCRSGDKEVFGVGQEPRYEVHDQMLLNIRNGLQVIRCSWHHLSSMRLTARN